MPSTEIGMPPDTNGRRISVCVIDDDELILGVLNKVLTNGGFDTTTTSVREEALRIAAENAPDVFLVDLHLGGHDGLDLLPNLRAVGYTGPVFMLSGDISNESAHAAAQAGADGYLVKQDAARIAEKLCTLLENIGAGSKRTSNFPPSARAYLETRGLTGWESELAAHFAADGANEKVIAACTGRSATAVRKGFESIRKKLGVSTQHDLARMLGVLSCFGGRR